MTERQQAIINFIATYREGHGYPPTVREIGKSVGLASSSTIHGHINRLEKNGFLTRKVESARTITLTEKGMHAICK
ncbi:hypothetical protein J25TS5_04390 [Paenibacillus faecis]|uniref:LexA family protein n=1 Tax=Paenibacillus faecis TaxID=862114 RepID=UPI001B02E0CA|nr:hypothetical protein [Paenibacillus faecis]GIO83507.1 hypothetical protein J25TS5_04390 [Paenibacillus faecis]